ncbi:hypothetical protein TWF730_006255 [Orbilia blumenaviensis]|uniref:Nephrocystin 3-like N-terminal domain-containing protein n=1 Tax=Orbilia blumenaviensis TaxID=1796055 RepID=A0AAV9VG44_9PEZI
MMSVSRALSAENPLICHFFFKKGEQDIQQSRTGLESLLYQLLDSDQLRNDLTTLAQAIDIINPGFKDSGNTFSSDGFFSSLASLCGTIRLVAGLIKQRVYLFVDALDECKDRREQNLGQHLLSIVQENPDNIRVIFSARDTINILEELPGQPDELKIIDITPEKNSTDLEEYLRHEAGAALNRRINRERFPKYFDKELMRIADLYGRLILASLQQPSKEPLETRIQRLPATIGDIYRASLESLTPDEQEFMVVFLKWVVWSVAGITIIEVSDHYREIYKRGLQDSSPRVLRLDGGEYSEEAPKSLGYDEEIMDLIANDPYEDPDVKDMIYHIENAGRDFLKFDRTTGLVSVDISIREWVQEDLVSKSKILESRGFERSRDQRGNTVFKFTLTPSFVQYGDSLNELFVKRDAQMSLAVDILRALNSPSFQNKYMPYPEGPWYEDEYNAESLGLPPKLRYEIRHWNDHIKTLQTWWNYESIYDSRWFELLTRLSIFIRPENFQKWRVQVLNIPEYALKYAAPAHIWEEKQRSHLQHLFQKPIHVACSYGLHLMVDYIIRVEKGEVPISIIPTPPDTIRSEAALKKRVGDFLTEDHWLKPGTPNIRPAALFQSLSCEELTSVLDGASTKITEDSNGALRVAFTEWVCSNLPTDVIAAWVGLFKSRSSDPRVYRFWFCQEVEKTRWNELLPSYLEKADDFCKKYEDDEPMLMANFKELLGNYFLKNRTSLLDVPDPYGRLPLYLAAAHPQTVQKLIEYGANPENMGMGLSRPDTKRRKGYRDCLELPLVSILYDLIRWGRNFKDETIQSMLQSAALLIPRTKNLEELRLQDGATLLHLAACIGDLDFFKLLCLSGRWNIYITDNNGNTPIHYLFRGKRRPNDSKKINAVLEISTTMLNMRRSGDDDLINIRNKLNASALGLAVQGYWVEAVRLLLDFGADPHDDDLYGYNCLHLLAQGRFRDWIDASDQKIELEIATVLVGAGVDCAKQARNKITPLFDAVVAQKIHLVEFFVGEYLALGKISQGSPDVSQNEIELFMDERSSNILHEAAEIRSFSGGWMASTVEESARFFSKVIATLLRYAIHIKVIQQLLLQVNNDYYIPIETAIASNNSRAVKEILAIQPNITSWKSPRGVSLLGFASWVFSFVVCRGEMPQLGDLGSDDQNSIPTLSEAKQIFNDLLGCTAPVSLDMFETEMFNPGPVSLYRWDYLLDKGYLDLQEISRRYKAPFRDEFGWTLVDLLTHLKREAMFDVLRITEREISPSEAFARPSRIGRLAKNFAGPSEDGLEFHLPGLNHPADFFSSFLEPAKLECILLYPKARSNL